MNAEETQSVTDVLLAELQTLDSFLERPVVWQQLILLAVIIFVGWLLARLTIWALVRLERRFSKPVTAVEPAARQRWIAAASELLFPIYAAILLQGAVWFLTDAGKTTGLLSGSMAFLWLLLVYRLAGALLRLRFDHRRVSYYQRRIIAPLAMWTLLVLAANILGLESIGSIELFVISDTSVTIARLLTSLTVFYFFVVGSSIMQEFLRTVVLPRTDADPGVINSILAVTRYVLIILAVVVSLGTLGFSLTTLAVIGGGLSIGVGIGLQQVISNFIAGILLLFEQSLRPGDIIELENEVGVVEKLNIRSTLVRTNDNVELVIPNETFLSSSLKTYTKSSRLVRIAIRVGVSYDSDAELVRNLLMNVAEQDEDVRDEPAPVVFFENFGESSLDFVLNVWVDDPIAKAAISSRLRFAIWESFAAHHIEIPFPQRDLHLRSGWPVTESTSMPGNG